MLSPSALVASLLAALGLVATAGSLAAARRASRALAAEAVRRADAQTALDEAHAHFTRLFRFLPEMVTLSTLDDGTLVDVNDNWSTLLGYRRDEGLGRRPIDLGLWLHPAELAGLHAELRAGRDVIDQPVTLVRRDGGHIETLLRARLLPVGKHDYVLSVCRDITEQRRLEKARQAAAEAQRVSEVMFSTAFHSSPESVTVSRLADGKLLEVNQAFLKLTGLTRDQALGATAIELGLWPFLEERAAVVELLTEHPALRDFPCTIGTIDGKRRDCLLNASTVRIAGQTCLICIIRDITEHKQAADRLHESQAKFETIFNSAPFALAVTRIADRVYLDANPGWEKLSGLKREDVLNRTSGELGLWVERPEYDDLYACFAHRDVLEQREVSLRPRGATTIATCLISARRLRIGDDDCALWSLVDISELRRIQATLEDLNTTLERRVTARTAELTAALEVLRQTQEELVRSEKMAALGSLVAGIAHELNTPIGNSVTVATTLAARTDDLVRAHTAGTLRRSDFDNFVSSARAATDLLMRSLLRAEELVRSFKQVAVDQTSEQRRSFELGEVLREMAITLSPMFRNSPFTLEIAPAEALTLDSYPGPLGQIFTNLVHNALLHAFDGRPRGRILITPRSGDGDTVEIEFADDGNGIPAANLRRIFDPFFTTRLGRGGSGLGLHIVYNLVTRVLGGRIAVHSAPDAGTRFVLTLPRVAPAPEAHAPDTGLPGDAPFSFEDHGPII